MSKSLLQCHLVRIEESLRSEGAAQKAWILAYCAYHYEEIGMTRNAYRCIRAAGQLVGPDTCPEIVKEVSLVNAQLQIARRDFLEARATLTEAIMAIHAWEETLSPSPGLRAPRLRDNILAEIEKEIGRSLADEFHALGKTKTSKKQKRELLEEAWLHYQLSHALLSGDEPESERIRGLLLDGSGALMHHYGVLRTHGGLSTRARIPALHPTFQRMGNAPQQLFAEARKHLAQSHQVFTAIQDHTGMGWALYHQGELCLDTEFALESSLQEAEDQLGEALDLFEHNELGSGLTHVQLYRARTAMFDLTGSKSHSAKAEENISALHRLVGGERPVATIIEDLMAELGIPMPPGP